MNAQIGYYDMDFIILDLRWYVNILTKQTWENMGKPKVWSPVYLRLSNKFKVMHIGRLPQVYVEVEGLRTHADFELIDIIDDKNIYWTLLGIDRSIEN